jgi:hypothetical protein
MAFAEEVGPEKVESVLRATGIMGKFGDNIAKTVITGVTHTTRARRGADDRRRLASKTRYSGWRY